MTPADLAALITGIGGVLSAVGGVMLTVRAVRNKERKAFKEELDLVEGMLETERHEHIQAEIRNYKLRMEMAQHGIDPDVPDDAH